jgi:hypothetical protein
MSVMTETVGGFCEHKNEPSVFIKGNYSTEKLLVSQEVVCSMVLVNVWAAERIKYGQSAWGTNVPTLCVFCIFF